MALSYSVAEECPHLQLLPTLHFWTPKNITGCICEKSAGFMSFHISFITISSSGAWFGTFLGYLSQNEKFSEIKPPLKLDILRIWDILSWCSLRTWNGSHIRQNTWSILDFSSYFFWLTLIMESTKLIDFRIEMSVEEFTVSNFESYNYTFTGS